MNNLRPKDYFLGALHNNNEGMITCWSCFVNNSAKSLFFNKHRPTALLRKSGLTSVRPPKRQFGKWHQPLMPELAIPSTSDFWKIRKMMVIGTRDRVDIANMAP